MTLREMEIFLAIIEHKTMRKASQELFISQPTISGAVASMESELNIKLFERIGKRLFLTSYGEKVRDYSKKIVNLHKEMLESIHDNNINERLNIGATVSVGGILLNKILAAWQGRQPFVHVTNTHEIEKKILQSELDCAIVEGDIYSQEIIKIPMFKDQMYLVCSAENHKFHNEKAKLSQLEGENLIMREVGSGTRERTMQILKENNINITALWQSNTIDAILQAVKNNIGVTILSEKLLIDDKSLKKIKITDCDFSRIFYFIYHKDKYRSRLFEDFFSVCKSLSDV